MEDMRETLSKIQARKIEFEKELIKTGLGELDEMVGGGFRPGTCNLIQEDLGAGAATIIFKIVENNLRIFNKVLIFLTDPTASFIVEQLQQIYTGDDLYILDFVHLSQQNFGLFSDIRDVSIHINDAIAKMMADVDEDSDEEMEIFTIFLSLTPFLNNMKDNQILELLMENIEKTKKYGIVNFSIMQKEVISRELHAKITSMFHGVIDLVSEYRGTQKNNYIRILKMAGRYYDLKMEPYVIKFDKETQNYYFLIKSAFLTTFDTYRDLLEWHSGQIFLNKIPYMLIPIDSFSSVLDIPLQLDPVAGRKELVEKGRYIARGLTISTYETYLLVEKELLKATVRTASLQGYGYIRIAEIVLSDNLLIFRHGIHPGFNFEAFYIFLEGFYAGMIKQCLKRDIKSIKFIKDESEVVDPLITMNMVNYLIQIRLDELKPDDLDSYEDFYH